MLLAQRFKTFEGACKRAMFENAHSKTHYYIVTFCGADDKPLTYATRNLVNHYRLTKTRSKPALTSLTMVVDDVYSRYACGINHWMDGE